MSIPGAANPLLLATAAAGGYQVSRSLRFNASDSAYLSRTPSSAGNRRTFTWSGWIKRSKLGLDGCRLFVAGSGANIFLVRMLTTDVLEIDFYNGTDYGFDTVAVFRDVSAWYHILVSVDTTQATAADRFKVYVNGAQITTLTSFGNVPPNTDLPVNNTVAHAIGNGGGNYYDGYLADIHFIDGQALTPSSFAETNATTGQWVPKAYSGSYGTNGFQLKFADNSNNTAATLGKDTSGNGNNWTPNNLSVTAGAGNDSLVDTPTSYGTDTGTGGEVRGNYATLNPLAKGSAATISDGNLKHECGSGGAPQVFASIGMSYGEGNFYCEYTQTVATGNGNMLGLSKQGTSVSNSYLGQDANGWGYYGFDGSKYNNNSSSSYGASWGANDVIGIAYKGSTGELFFYKNGVAQNSGTAAFSGLTSGPYFFTAGNASGGTGYFNFGQRPFAYTAPSGFKALCTANLPAPTIAQPSTVMDVKLYTGNGSTQTISGLGFSPDLVWIKSRSAAYNNRLYDQVRGVENVLNSNTTAAEGSDGGGVTAFTSTGFTLGSSVAQNENNTTYAAWTWDAGSSTVTNTQGSISSQVRANASAGFSIVTYTGNGTVGATVGHGLGITPGMVIVKRRDNASSARWAVQHASLNANQLLALNTTAAVHTEGAGAGSTFNVTKASSTVITLGDYGDSNANTGTYVAYCFAPVAGYSSFGSYTGNGSADGPFVYTGMRARWILLKRTDTNGDWILFDAARDPKNVCSLMLFPNTADAEFSNATYLIDVLSNGFKLRQTGPSINASSGSFVYVAFAESPLQYARAR